MPKQSEEFFGLALCLGNAQIGKVLLFQLDVWMKCMFLGLLLPKKRCLNFVTLCIIPSLLSSSLQEAEKVALFHKAFYSFVFSFRLKLMWWWVSVCQSSSMYPVEAQDSCSLKRNKSHICTFSSSLWPFPTVTYAIISVPVSLTDLCVLLFCYHQQIYLCSTSVSEIHSHFSAWEELARFTGVYKCNSPTQFLPSFQCRHTPILHLAGLI